MSGILVVHRPDGTDSPPAQVMWIGTSDEDGQTILSWDGPIGAGSIDMSPRGGFTVWITEPEATT